MSFKKKYNNDNILYIPNFENTNKLYNINDIYTPRKFTDTDEYIIHLENLRKLRNYVNINKHLDLLNNSVYKNIIKDKLIKKKWANKIKEKQLEEINNMKELKEQNIDKIINKTKKEKNNIRCKSSLENANNKTKKINIRCKSSLENANNKTKKNIRCNSSLNYKNLKKVNITKKDINDVRKDLKLDKLKLPKI